MRLGYTIPIVPVTKKNSQQILRTKQGRPFIAPSKKYKAYEKEALVYIVPPRTGPIDQPCNVKALFYMPTRRRVDLVNLEEALLDVLVIAGVLADDNAAVVASMDGSRVLYDKANPRTEIEIEINEVV